MSLPRMYRIRQSFDTPRLADVAGEVRRQLASLELGNRVQPGQTVAITVGSRGVANVALITREIVQHFLALGAKPFVVPAMGSHGGATAAGQRALIESFGVTEAFIGCPIQATMETVVVDRTPQGIPVHFDKNASQADHVFIANRIKPHTMFVGPIESGLHKMMLIGLGKHAGAVIYHRAIKSYTFLEIIRAVADVVVKRCRVLGGLAIVENALEETALVEGVPVEQFYEREVILLEKARQWMPRLPLDDIDLLVVDEIGKEISGTGMDTNVVGRKFNDHAATAEDKTNCRRIFIRGLTQKTHGNGTGIGLSEFTNRRTVESLDMDSTKVNCITAGHATAAMIPVYYDTDAEVVETALKTLGLTEPEDARVVQIQNTLLLGEMLVSESCLPQLTGNPRVTVMAGPFDWAFDAARNLTPVGCVH
ncbi:MAG: DUF2088 domain-containing protein [Planctomycetota bacterium]|nr:MAG: DUF2088 domain-containing protein [Planctomycetota bacterium]